MLRFPQVRSIRRSIFVLLVSGTVTGLLASGSGLAADMDASAKVLVTLDDDWSKVAATKDAARVASFYAEDAIAYPPNEPLAIGRAAAQKVWAAYFADPSFSISWKTVHAQVSGDLGYTAGTYEATYKGTDGKLVSEKGKYLCAWRKEKDGAWKAIHDMWNTDTK